MFSCFQARPTVIIYTFCTYYITYTFICCFIVFTEEEDRDVSCVISSLIQIMVDPHFRSITGFESLIQKEWTAMGHPFTTRNGFLKEFYSSSSMQPPSNISSGSSGGGGGSTEEAERGEVCTLKHAVFSHSSCFLSCRLQCFFFSWTVSGKYVQKVSVLKLTSSISTHDRKGTS